MNADESLDETPADLDFVDVKEEEENEKEQEKTVSARLLLTKEQQSDLLEAFNLLDYTGEGKIKAEDFRVAVKALGYEPTKEELQKMINAVDKGNTGRLSFENFQTAIMRKIMSQDNDGDIMKSFRLYDIDDTGLISFDNLKKVTQILEIPLTDEEIEEMIDDADKNFDSFVSVEEFMKMIKNCVHIVTP
ncbi:caltractin-like [Helicoverpa zea]|uniref:caltractin-like n=1 Tax=Helicoverpa zea TaxID=7113 RepID=UPI000B3A1384|nr:uncharacterized protein LOC110380819 [Helicoverpa armigera]XP_047039092.1 caltractin-like [Helicoverpa zea]